MAEHRPSLVPRDPFQSQSIESATVISRRPPRNVVDSRRPHAWLVEQECNALGEIVDVATLFLTNRECPFRCLMCDLWKNTLTHRVSPGEIPEQIRWGLQQIQSSTDPSSPREIKLYNSGNFFDRAAIPESDYQAIAELVRGFETVIVENHPKLCGDACFRFRDLIAPAQLEIAIGLETCHAPSLEKLCKSMTLDDFERATRLLHDGDIRTRVFLLQGLPWMTRDESTSWTMRSLDYAFGAGVSACSMIATRVGNGVMDDLLASGHFMPPTGASLECLLDAGIAMRRGRVFVDLWEVDSFFACECCRQQRIDRLRIMNLTQRGVSPIACPSCGHGQTTQVSGAK